MLWKRTNHPKDEFGWLEDEVIEVLGARTVRLQSGDQLRYQGFFIFPSGVSSNQREFGEPFIKRLGTIEISQHRVQLDRRGPAASETHVSRLWGRSISFVCCGSSSPSTSFMGPPTPVPVPSSCGVPKSSPFVAISCFKAPILSAGNISKYFFSCYLTLYYLTKKINCDFSILLLNTKSFFSPSQHTIIPFSL